MRRLAVVLAVAALPAASGVIANAQSQPAQTRVFQVALAGENETPAGDPVATGTAAIRVRAGQAKICYQLVVHDLAGRAAAAHIHRGTAGTAGPVVIALRTPNAAGKSSGCAKTARGLVKALLAHPNKYYVNVHTAEFPAGAVRAQLAGTRTSVGTILHLQLQGTSEPNATGTAVLRIRKNAGLICYRLHVANVTLPTAAAHIHKAAAGATGPVAFPFTAPGADGNSSGCGTAPASLIDEILANRA